jgi:hypothetical protein
MMIRTLTLAMLLCSATLPAHADDPVERPFPVPISPGLPSINHRSLGTDLRWSVAPTYSFYILPGGGLSRYFDQMFGVGGELSYRLFVQETKNGRPVKKDWRTHLRWLGDFSYVQMTPGATLAPSISSSSSSLFSPVTGSPTGPIPGSASITGFIAKTGLAWDLPEVTPEKWGLRRVLVPYLRIDVGGVDLAVSDVPEISGHPYGALLDLGAGLGLRIPDYPLGVFGEIDPTLIDIGGNIVTITPLVAGIMWRF